MQLVITIPIKIKMRHIAYRLISPTKFPKTFCIVIAKPACSVTNWLDTTKATPIIKYTCQLIAPSFIAASKSSNHSPFTVVRHINTTTNKNLPIAPILLDNAVNALSAGKKLGTTNTKTNKAI